MIRYVLFSQSIDTIDILRYDTVLKNHGKMQNF